MNGSTNRGQDVQPVSNSVDADAHALTVAITRGDREALGQLFDRYYTMMLNECRKSSGTNSILAEDAAQEAWLRVARRPVAPDNDRHARPHRRLNQLELAEL